MERGFLEMFDEGERAGSWDHAAVATAISSVNPSCPRQFRYARFIQRRMGLLDVASDRSCMYKYGRTNAGGDVCS